MDYTTILQDEKLMLFLQRISDISKVDFDNIFTIWENAGDNLNCRSSKDIKYQKEALNPEPLKNQEYTKSILVENYICELLNKLKLLEERIIVLEKRNK